MANPAPTINQINAFNATQGTIIDFNIIGGTELVRSNRIYIYDLSDNSLICTHLYVSTESIHELPANTDSSIVYESGKSSADFVNGAQYYAQIQTYTDTAGTEGGSGLSVAKMFWCLVDPTLTITTIPSTISTTSYNVSATYTDTSASVVSNIIQQYQFNLYSATGSLLQSSGVVVGSGEQQGTSTAYDISYNFTGLSVGSSYYIVVDVTTTQGMSVSTQSNTFTVSIDTPTLGEATVVNNACDGYISVTSNLSGEYGGSASGEIASFVTSSVNDVSSLKVTLTPQQDGTPWIGTDHDTAPYLNRAMPTQSNDYNRENGVIVGGTVAWNQICTNGNFADGTNNWTTTKATISAENGVLSLLLTESGGFVNALRTVAVNGHKYVTLADINISNGQAQLISAGGVSRLTTKTGSYETVGAVWTSPYAGSSFSFPRVYDLRTSGWDAVKIKNVMVFDLTQMFGSTIADYIYSLEQATAGAGVAWFRRYFPEEYYQYSANTLQSVQATAHKTYDADGNVIGNYALDSSLTLRGIPKLDASNNLYYDGDTYASDGTVTRRYSSLVLDGTNVKLSGTFGSAANGYAVYKSMDIPPNARRDGNLISDRFTCSYSGIDYMPLMSFVGQSGATSTVSFILPSSVTSLDEANAWFASNPTTIVYELATPTNETAQAYTNPQVVDSDGTEEYVTSNYVPVGHDSTYSLVCPISGWDEVETHKAGKNLFDPTSVTVNNSTLDGDTFTTNFINSAYYASKSRVFPAGTYTVSITSYNCYLRMYIERENGTRLFQSTLTTASLDTKSYTFTAEEEFVIRWGGVSPYGTYTYKVQLEFGSTATDYEPYNTDSASYTTQLPTTVYGGTLDVVSGVLTVDRAMVNIENTIASTPYMGNTNKTVSLTLNPQFPQNYTDYYFIAEQYKYITHKNTASAMNNPDSMEIGMYAYHNSSSHDRYRMYLVCPKEITPSGKMAYRIANPTTIQCDQQTVQTLIGDNNVWGDGEVEVVYNIPITNLLVKRQDIADVSGTWLTLYSQPITQASDMDFTFIDFLNQYGKTYKYALVPLLTQTQSGVEVEVEGGYTVSDEVQSVFDGVFIADQTGSQKCKANVGYGDVDMNQAVGTITPIGAKYPVVITNSKNQYHNGSISGTIVPDDYYFNGNLSRIDMVNKRNELEQFLTNKRAKIIKDWNSNIWLVMIIDNINCSFDNNYGMGMVNFNASWIEVGDPTNQQDLQAAGLIDVGGV